MTFETFQLGVAYGGAVFLLVLMFALVAHECWRAVWRRGKGFASAFAIGAAIATIHAQKPPVVKQMNLRVYNVTAKGFDCSWDYGDLTPADFTDGETVKLTAEVVGPDHTLVTYIVGTLPTTVTNYHVNAAALGWMRDWMAYDLRVEARCNNLLMGTATHDVERTEDGDAGTNDDEGVIKWVVE